jgi:hypothetical protein
LLPILDLFEWAVLSPARHLRELCGRRELLRPRRLSGALLLSARSELRARPAMLLAELCRRRLSVLAAGPALRTRLGVLRRIAVRRRRLLRIDRRAVLGCRRLLQWRLQDGQVPVSGATALPLPADEAASGGGGMLLVAGIGLWFARRRRLGRLS